MNVRLLCLLALCLSVACNFSNGAVVDENVAVDSVNKLSDKIRLVLSKYRQDGVVALPGLTDPMPMKDYQHSFSVGTLTFTNTTVHGLSNYTVEEINTDLDAMQVLIVLHMKQVVIHSNYFMSAAFLQSSGCFNATLLDVEVEGAAQIEVNPEGRLEAVDSKLDIIVGEKKVHFSKLGLVHKQIINSYTDTIFDNIITCAADRVNPAIRNIINNELEDLTIKFNNDVSPVQLAFSEARKYARERGYDQLKIEHHNFDIWGLIYVNVTQFRVEGLSRFYRVGNLSLSMDAGVIEVGIHVTTGKLIGGFTWSGRSLGISKSGKINFTVDHLQVRALVNQSLDVTRKPHLARLDVELGVVNVTMDSTMVVGQMVERVVNATPRLIRHVIVDAVEAPLREFIQDIFNQIDMETAVEEYLTRLDTLGL